MIENTSLIKKLEESGDPDFLLLAEVFSKDDILAVENESSLSILYLLNRDQDSLNRLFKKIEAIGVGDKLSTFSFGLAIMHIKVHNIVFNRSLHESNSSIALGLPLFKKMYDSIRSVNNSNEIDRNIDVNFKEPNPFKEITLGLKTPLKLPGHDMSTIRLKSDVPLEIVSFALSMFKDANPNLFDDSFQGLLEHEDCGDKYCFLCYLRNEKPNALKYFESISLLQNKMEDFGLVDGENTLRTNKKVKNERKELKKIVLSYLELVKMLCVRNHSFNISKSEKEVFSLILDQNKLFQKANSEQLSFAPSKSNDFSLEYKLKYIANLLDK
jgi:hypothetical protein